MLMAIFILQAITILALCVIVTDLYRMQFNMTLIRKSLILLSKPDDTKTTD